MPTRILYVNTPTYVGGAEISLTTLIKHLSSGYSPYVLTSGEGAFAERVRGLSVPVLFQDFPWFSRRRPWVYFLSVARLARTVRGRDISLIHTNCDHCLRYVMLASRWAGVPYVSHVRDLVRGWFRPDNVRALNGAKCVIANSNATASACERAGIRRESLKRIYNPVDVDAFTSAPESVRGEVLAGMNIPSDALVVGIVGQVQPIKGQMEFVEAALDLSPRVPMIHFIIVGAANSPSDEEYLRCLQRRVRGSEHAARFHFTGFREDVPVLMKAIDILTVPSWDEPFGRVAVEGMASACAVVASSAGGLAEIVRSGEDGLLVPPRDPKALAAAIEYLALNPSVAREMSGRGPAAAARFAADNHVSEVQSLYRSVLSDC